MAEARFESTLSAFWTLEAIWIMLAALRSVLVVQDCELLLGSLDLKLLFMQFSAGSLHFAHHRHAATQAVMPSAKCTISGRAKRCNHGCPSRHNDPCFCHSPTTKGSQAEKHKRVKNTYESENGSCWRTFHAKTTSLVTVRDTAGLPCQVVPRTHKALAVRQGPPRKLAPSSLQTCSNLDCRMPERRARAASSVVHRR